MEKLIELLAQRKTQVRFHELVELRREHCLFTRVLGEGDEELDRGF